jgi:hypothetical protein
MVRKVGDVIAALDNEAAVDGVLISTRGCPN